MAQFEGLEETRAVVHCGFRLWEVRLLSWKSIGSERAFGSVQVGPGGVLRDGLVVRMPAQASMWCR